MNLVHKLLIVNMLILLLVPIGHIPLKTSHSSQFSRFNTSSVEQTNQVINGNVTVGSNMTVSYYTISGNLTITENSSFTLINTVMTFSFPSGNSSYLNDRGYFRLYNSEITMDPGLNQQNHLNITIRGNAVKRAVMSLSSSDIIAGGSLTSCDAYLDVRNSSIAAPSSQYSHISTSFTSSHVIFYNSTYYGLTRSDSVSNYTAGTAYLKRVPYSYNGYMGFNWNIAHPVSLIRRVDVTFSYGGYTKGNDSYMLMNLSGENYYRYVFNSTGSFDNITEASFSFGINGTLPKMGSILKSAQFTSFLTMVQYQDNITIYNLSVKFVSNDTVSLKGISSYNYVLSNTTMYAVDSGFQLNYLRNDLYDNVPNPMKNSFILMNSSILQGVRIYSLLSTRSEVMSPFSIENSSVFLYSLQKIAYQSREGPVKNVSGIVSSSALNSTENSYADGMNSAISSFLNSTGILEGMDLPGRGQYFPLLRIEESGNVDSYYGNYFLKADGGSVHFSESASGITLGNSTPVTLELSLPEISAHLSYGRIKYDSPFHVNLSISSIYAPSGNFSADLVIFNSSFRKVVREFNLSVGLNQTTSVDRALDPGKSVRPGSYTLLLTIVKSGYIYNGNDTLFRSGISVFRNVTLRLSYIYNRTIAPNGIVMNVTVENSGMEYANSTALSVRFYSFGSEIYSYMSSFKISPGGSVMKTIRMTSGDTITNATIVTRTSGKSLPEPSYSSSENVTFKPGKSTGPAYALLTVISSGLPGGTLWSFSINGTVYSSITEGIMVKLPLGERTIHVLGLPGYHPQDRNIDLNITHNATINISYIRTVYSVKFNAIGLPEGASWTLSINGLDHTIAGGTYTTSLPNGTYGYSLEAPGNYTFKTGSGTIFVDGSNITVNSSAIRIVHRTLVQSLLDEVIGVWPVPVAILAVASFFLYRRERNSVFICGVCGSTMSSRFGKCGCNAKKESGNERVK